ncbi:hypothetical protein BGZ60DRAFT_555790 [Tricladium varicosporioides]|nr:hypothetical protein BGZ60DRAFT_555790 [Hymenoscyphus varicosporioides]
MGQNGAFDSYGCFHKAGGRRLRAIRTDYAIHPSRDSVGGTYHRAKAKDATYLDTDTPKVLTDLNLTSSSDVWGSVPKIAVILMAGAVFAFILECLLCKPNLSLWAISNGDIEVSSGSIPSSSTANYLPGSLYLLRSLRTTFQNLKDILGLVKSPAPTFGTFDTATAVTLKRQPNWRSQVAPGLQADASTPVFTPAPRLSLSRHLRDFHDGKKRHSCQYCGKRMKSMTEFES